MSWIIRRKVDMSRFDDNNKEHQRIGPISETVARELSSVPYVTMRVHDDYPYAFTEVGKGVMRWHFHKDWTIPVCPLEEALLCPDL